MIQQKDIIGYSLSNSFRDVVLEDVLKMFVGKADVELVKLPTKKKTDKIAVSSTLDFGANEIINVIIKGDAKKLNVRPVDGKIIKPLYLFLDKEVLLYVKIKKLKFKKDKKKMSEISKFIDELEIKHPEVKRAIVNGWLKVCN
jgi:tRNA(Ile)-lysidine synthase TilS/MesJ